MKGTQTTLLAILALASPVTLKGNAQSNNLVTSYACVTFNGTPIPNCNKGVV